jgi:hypothetical protein
MAAVLLLAAPVLRAPADPGVEGLLVLVALILLGGLVAAHIRLLRAVSRANAAATAGATPPPSAEPGRGEPGRSEPPTEASPVDDPVRAERR